MWQWSDALPGEWRSPLRLVPSGAWARSLGARRGWRGWYTPDEAAALFEALDRLDASARAVYATTALTIDMVFPASYGLLLAILLFRLFRGGAPLYLLPVAVALADGLENITVAALALSHDGAPSFLAWPAAVFTALKTALFVATLAVTCVGAMRWMWQRRRHPR